MRLLDDRKHLPRHRRPKGADIDKPAGYVKAKLRQKWRAVLKRSLSRESHEDRTRAIAIPLRAIRSGAAAP